MLAEAFLHNAQSLRCDRLCQRHGVIRHPAQPLLPLCIRIIRQVTVVPNTTGEPDLDIMGDLASLLAEAPMNGNRFVLVAGPDLN